MFGGEESLGKDDVVQGYVNRALDVMEEKSIDGIFAECRIAGVEVDYMEIDVEEKKLKVFWFYDDNEDEVVGLRNQFLSNMQGVQDYDVIHRVEPVEHISSNVTELPDFRGDVYLRDGLSEDEVENVSKLLGGDLELDNYMELEIIEQ